MRAVAIRPWLTFFDEAVADEKAPQRAIDHGFDAVVSFERHPKRQRRAKTKRAVGKDVAVDLPRDPTVGFPHRRHGMGVVIGQRDVESVVVSFYGGKRTADVASFCS
jgi:hypothetical protein